jgi:hypothetical protein
MPIVTPCDPVEEIRRRLRETPLGAVRERLPDRAILAACRVCGHEFRRRQYDPIVTVLHYLLHALQRETSFAATWQDLWTPAAADVPAVAAAMPDPSALTHARLRLPVGVLQSLAARAIRQTQDASDGSAGTTSSQTLR